MDKTSMLAKRKNQILSVSKNIRKFIDNFLDEYSFAETDTFIFGKRDLFGSESFGEGVITGHATVDGIPVCLFAQNYEICKGGLSKGQADKILKIQKQAVKTGAVMVSVIDTAGIKLGDGITALEGYAEIIAQSNSMYGIVPQITIIKGNCLGAMSYYAALSDFVIMCDDSIAATNSPLIISASSNSDIKPKELCGAATHQNVTGFATITVKNEEELSNSLKKILNLLSTEEEFNPETDFNNSADILNNGYNTQNVIDNLFDESSFIELNKGYAQDIICGIGKLGGITVGALMCGNDNNGIYLNSLTARKAAKFIRLLDRFNIPLISFVNCAGVCSSIETEQSSVINDISLLLSSINDFESVKLSVICNRAIGIGYTAFASKSIGFDNCIAWVNAVISPIGEEAASLIEYDEEIKNAKNPIEAKDEAIKKYADIQADPFNAAKEGSIDNIIEPAVTKQYILSMLMMLL